MTSSATETPWLSPTATSGPWTDGDNAFVQDGVSVNAMDSPQLYSNFDVGIPSGATVQGIRLDLHVNNLGNLSVTLIGDLSYDGGASWTASDNIGFTGYSGEYATLGGPTDRWGRASWSIPELSDANLRVRLVRLGAPAPTMFLDHARLKVYHSATGGDKNLFNFDGATQIELANTTLRPVGWTGTTIYVDGVAGGEVADPDWHHVVITSATPVAASNLQIGGVSAEAPPFDGALDDIKLFEQVLSAADAATLFAAPACGL